MTEQPIIWVLADDRAGNRSQCLGVADLLGLPYEIKDLTYTAAGALPNFVMGATFSGLERNARVNLSPPWPTVVIAAGRRTAPVARRIKELSGGTAKLVQIMYPGDAGADEFDLIAVPRHDRMAERDNLLIVTGAPHRVTPVRLAEAQAAWTPRFAHLPGPKIALIVGGSTKRRAFTAEMGAELGRTANQIAEAAGGSLLVSTSRRTGEAADAVLAAITVPAFTFRWGDEGENPYMGFLACGDAIIVTGDSVSMCCEACATEVPVYIYAPKGFVAHKHGLLHQELFERGVARPLADRLDDWQHPPMNAASVIARAIREVLI